MVGIHYPFLKHCFCQSWLFFPYSIWNLCNGCWHRSATLNASPTYVKLVILMAALFRLSVKSMTILPPASAPIKQLAQTNTQNKSKFITAYKSCIQIHLPATDFKIWISFLQVSENKQYFCFAVFYHRIRKLFLISWNITSKYHKNKPLTDKGSSLLPGYVTEYHVKKIPVFWIKIISSVL